MSTSLLTPVELSGPAVQTAPRRYRKQILPLGTITYQGQKIKFDKQYMRDLISAFNDRAVEQVPWQIADPANKHNNYPENTRGDVVALEMSATGLDAVLEVSERGEQLLKENPKLGVSARIVSNHERANDGKVFPRVLQHVLGTVNPRVVGLKPWEKVDLSEVDSSEIIDLSTEQFDTPEDKMTTTTVDPNKKDEGELVSVQLSKEDHAAFLEMLADQKTAKELALSSPDGEDDEEPEDEGDEGEDENKPQPMGLSVEAAAALELANAKSDAADARSLELANQLRMANVDRELDEYRNKGLAPAVVDLARPLLAGKSEAIELSNGDKTDTGTQVRELLKAVVELANSHELIVDLAAEDGFAVGGAEDTAHQAKLSAWANEQY